MPEVAVISDDLISKCRTRGNPFSITSHAQARWFSSRELNSDFGKRDRGGAWKLTPTGRARFGDPFDSGTPIWGGDPDGGGDDDR